MENFSTRIVVENSSLNEQERFWFMAPDAKPDIIMIEVIIVNELTREKPFNCLPRKMFYYF